MAMIQALAHKTILMVLGGQLSSGVAALRDCDPASTVVLMAEVGAEANYVGHHQKKLAFIFSAMRHLAEELRNLRWTVDYLALDNAENSKSISGEITQ
jgi:deoxyribodipyrimidine photolyase-related protein